MTHSADYDAPLGEGDHALLRVRVARGNDEQALIEFRSMEGPYSVRVPQAELIRVIPPEQHD